MQPAVPRLRTELERLIRLIDGFAGADGGPFAELCAAEPGWQRTLTRRHRSWIENVHDVDAGRPAREARSAAGRDAAP